MLFQQGGRVVALQKFGRLLKGDFRKGRHVEGFLERLLHSGRF